MHTLNEAFEAIGDALLDTETGLPWDDPLKQTGQIDQPQTLSTKTK